MCAAVGLTNMLTIIYLSLVTHTHHFIFYVLVSQHWCLGMAYQAPAEILLDFRQSAPDCFSPHMCPNRTLVRYVFCELLLSSCGRLQRVFFSVPSVVWSLVVIHTSSNATPQVLPWRLFKTNGCVRNGSEGISVYIGLKLPSREALTATRNIRTLSYASLSIS